MKKNTLLSLITCPLSMAYGLVVGVRSFLFNKNILHANTYPIPIICVGNLAVGGTGKTPHVEYLLRLLHHEGLRVAMLSRGYGRKTQGYILADNSKHTASDIGDEPYQMMQNCPFATIAVCEKRTYGVEKLLQLKPQIEVIVLDDAYQHRYVKAGLNILLTDAHRLYTHDHLLPWGRLRECASAAQRANVVIVTKCTENQKPFSPTLSYQTLYYSHISYNAPCGLTQGDAKESTYQSQKVLLIAGVANPYPLMQHLQKQGAKVTLIKFPDHHTFSRKDAQRINQVWQQGHYTMAVTTQKDSVRLYAISDVLSASLIKHCVVQPITVEIENNKPNKQISFNQYILNYVRTNKRNCKVD